VDDPVDSGKPSASAAERWWSKVGKVITWPPSDGLGAPALQTPAVGPAAPAAPSMVPTTGWAFVTCMDTRVDVARLFGDLGPGDAHVIRNAGGIVTDDTIRSLAISQRAGRTDAVFVVHHTDCAMTTFTDVELADRLERESGVRPTWVAGTFSNTEDDVRRSVEKLRASPFLPHVESVRGFVCDVHTGVLREVEGLGTEGPSASFAGAATGQAMWGGWW